ncbi:MAG: sugar-binding domain-containing protein, partial [Planctomycetaceae bacterium]
MSFLDWPVIRTGNGLAAMAIVASLGLSAATANAADWRPAEGPLMTRWAKEVSPENVLPEYPRPQMVRKEWMNLNGLWDYAIRPKAETDPPAEWDGQILVPFAVESALSGVMKTVGPDNELWYRRTFEVPPDWNGQRVLLHFGAVDWDMTLIVNGKEAGKHQGGYDPFSFDITEALSESGKQEILVRVWDPSDAEAQPRGKQVRDPQGIWYTSVTGIWQTVWLEPVPEASIETVRFVPDVDGQSVRITVQGRNTGNRHAAFVTIRKVSKGDSIETIGPIEDHALTGEEINLALSPVKLWSPDEPWLYHA